MFDELMVGGEELTKGLKVALEESINSMYQQFEEKNQLFTAEVLGKNNNVLEEVTNFYKTEMENLFGDNK